MENVRKLRSLRCLAAACAAAGLAVFAAPAAYAASPSITVDPSTGLADGQSVVVAGNGFPAGKTVYVTECSGSNPANPVCEQVDQHGTVAQDGSVTVSATAHRTFDGYDPAGNPAGSVTCNATTSCWMAAAVDRSTFAPPAPISFG